MALNGTTVTGAGAAAQDLLTAANYTKVADATDAPAQDVTRTTIYYRPDDTGQNEADARWVAKKYFKGAAVKKLNEVFGEAGLDSWTLAAFATAPQPELNDRTPVDAFGDTDIEPLLLSAHRTVADLKR